eukprot:TRINITY_DN3965_c0_g1_i1.p2 TRINITY_DN3965_c0_g1~~TRINITY_DN3965_c0_g1_i1.p2  ORF type:complete len:144 (+),score=19.78 TRINITY_DN3965_c0_g1_i1:27-458(+)
MVNRRSRVILTLLSFCMVWMVLTWATSGEAKTNAPAPIKFVETPPGPIPVPKQVQGVVPKKGFDRTHPEAPKEVHTSKPTISPERPVQIQAQATLPVVHTEKPSEPKETRKERYMMVVPSFGPNNQYIQRSQVNQRKHAKNAT